MHLKNVGFTYKSQIFKFMIQQKVFNKKLRKRTKPCTEIITQFENKEVQNSPEFISESEF